MIKDDIRQILSQITISKEMGKQIAYMILPNINDYVMNNPEKFKEYLNEEDYFNGRKEQKSK